ncbi:poly A polymerase C-terminal region-like protein [Zopfia rhizophila CBS 207.26]|uniref:Poly A polymerase C-terminal region-like protein n=1 Tax=Zopfia rhizophila CBS 207.26 TaxID=1314779 RepID=A0A6A6EB52_9PEZI|nr:poly A polymerase C-terminal region-like protein [Zopfia rhizophila CBS 207.26]
MAQDISSVPFGATIVEPPSGEAIPTTIKLTDVEKKLRILLLDVAEFIDGMTPVSDSVKAPEDSLDETPVPDPSNEDEKVKPELAGQRIVLRFTGGWVRDKLLGVGSHDIDVAINKMTGLEFGLKLKEYLELPGHAQQYGLVPAGKEDGKSSGKDKSRKVAPGLYKIEANPEKSKHLETITTNILGLDIDFVNLRKETYTEDSRNPQMEFGTPEEDALRRDATINAMFYNLNTSKIEDFTRRGFEDMGRKIIRTPLDPYQTFKDDPLRVLRLIRFASRLNYTIDDLSQNAMANEEILKALKVKISRERVGIEIDKMLKGPDPCTALRLIDSLGLYNTIFTDPTRELEYNPNLEKFSEVYTAVRDISQNIPDIPLIISKTLLRNPDEQYLAWICASLIPWADAPMVPNSKPNQRPHYAATLVAREGLKAPNRISDVVTGSLRDAEEIGKLVDQCHRQIKWPTTNRVGLDATARDTLGMAIRRWGPTWRSQVWFTLLHELFQETLGSESHQRIYEKYAIFLEQLTKHDVLDAYAFKPLLTGKDLARALNTDPGSWMKDALDVVMEWQLANPGITDPSAAIEAVKVHKAETLHKAATAEQAGGAEKGAKPEETKKNRELPSRLATHFLQLTIRPLFSQNKPHPTLTPAGHASALPKDGKARFPEDTSDAPWKDPKQGHAIELLRWVLSVLGTKGVETNWGLLIPPILKLMDDISLKWKAVGCEMLTLLLKSTPPALLKRTGLGNVFEESLWPLFTYLPNLTEEKESAALLDEVFPALRALADAMYPPSKPTDQTSSSTPREKFLDKILREGILAPTFHAPPSTYPHLATILLKHLPSLQQAMGIDSVKHLQSLIPLLANILSEPLAPAYPPLMVVAAKGAQGCVLNAWPRISVHRGDILKGLTVSWIRVEEEKAKEVDGERQGELEGIMKELKTCVGMLDAVLNGVEDVKWEDEKRELIGADERLRGLFEENGE